MARKEQDQPPPRRSGDDDRTPPPAPGGSTTGRRSERSGLGLALGSGEPGTSALSWSISSEAAALVSEGSNSTPASAQSAFR